MSRSVVRGPENTAAATGWERWRRSLGHGLKTTGPWCERNEVERTLRAVHCQAIKFILIDFNLKSMDSFEKLNEQVIRDFQNKNYTRALETLNSLLIQQPRIASLWEFKGIILDELKQFNEAIEAYKQALVLDPNLFRAWYNLGLAYVNVGNTKQAVYSFAKSAEINPKYGNAWYSLGIELENLGRPEDAIKVYNKALEIEPNALDVRHRLESVELFLNVMELSNKKESKLKGLFKKK